MKRALIPFFAAAVIAALPLGQEPHLLQKWKLFANGWLTQPMDWFDFAFHGLPLVAAIAHALVLFMKNRRTART